MSGLLKKDHDSEEHMATKPNVEEYYRDDPAKLKKELEKKEKLVQSALQHRFKKMEAEEIKLRQIRSTLKSLSVDTGKEIHVLRGKIENTESMLAKAEGTLRYKEKEIIELKESVNKLRDKKNLLTEHLSTIIYESEKKKQEKLKELMVALDLGDVTQEEAEEAWKGFDVHDDDD